MTQKIKYIVRYIFVDNTYWDDGNRYTSRTDEVEEDKLDEFINSLIAGQRILHSNITGEQLKRPIDKDAIFITKVTEEEIPLWFYFNDKEYIIKEMALYIRAKNFNKVNEIISILEKKYDEHTIDYFYTKALGKINE